ncbi:class I SAM-dependent methyltransferase [Streptomyces sp. NPDC001312]|uniref:class I SAM-dependent methyltransferase n=1 Tax=Streptomyces sp. NPDC001312 TaxID=3364561 RepID=UPI00368BCE98
MPVEDINTKAWKVYGQRQLARAYIPPIPDQLAWAPWEGVGPGAEVLGDITGRRVLDMGSGAGHHAIRLVQAHGARVTGIELSPSQHERAVTGHADVQGVQFVQGDVAEYLAGAEPFDAAYAIGTLGFFRGACSCRSSRKGCSARCRRTLPPRWSVGRSGPVQSGTGVCGSGSSAEEPAQQAA